MKNIFIFLLLLSCSVFSQETSLKVSESKKFKEKNKRGSTGVLAMHTSSNGNTGLIRFSRNSILTYVLDHQLGNVKTQEIPKDKKESFEGYVLFEDEIKFITVVADSRKDRTVYAHSFNVQTNRHTKKKLFSTSVEGGLFNGKNKRKTNVVISPNGKYIAIATDNVKKNINAYKIHVYDAESLMLVYEKSYHESDETNYIHNDLYVNDEATVYSIGKLYQGGIFSKKDDRIGNYNFSLSKISKIDYQSTNISLDDDNYITSLSFNNHEGNMNLVGFYSEKDRRLVKGICNFEIDKNNLNLLSTNYQELPKSVYEDLYRSSKAERQNKKKKEQRLFGIDHIITDESGNVYIVAEQYFTSTQTYTDANGNFVNKQVRHYNDLMILYIDINGEIIWGRGIYKRENHPSYNAFYKDGNLHVILNSAKNITEKKDGRKKLSKGAFQSTSLYDITFTKSGEAAYNKIQDNKRNTYYLPYYGTFSSDRFVMINDKSRKRQFMILE